MDICGAGCRGDVDQPLSALIPFSILHPYTHAHTHTHTHTRHTHKHMHARAHPHGTHTNTRTHTRAHTYTYTHTCTLTRTHTHTHTHTHTTLKYAHWPLVTNSNQHLPAHMVVTISIESIGCLCNNVTLLVLFMCTVGVKKKFPRSIRTTGAR